MLRFFRLPLSAALPLAYLLLAVQVSHNDRSRIHARDPTYCYAVNTFSAAVGQPVHFHNHPGVPLQILGGAAHSIKYWLFPESGLPKEDELLEHHAEYLRFIALLGILA